MKRQYPIVEMPEEEIGMIADLVEVDFNKVRGIVWLAEWRMRGEFERINRRIEMYKQGSQ